MGRSKLAIVEGGVNREHAYRTANKYRPGKGGGVAGVGSDGRVIQIESFRRIIEIDDWGQPIYFDQVMARISEIRR